MEDKWVNVSIRTKKYRLILGGEIKMCEYNWQDVDDKDIESLIEKINALITVAMFDAGNSALEIADLCFYKNFRLLKATTFDSRPPIAMRYLIGRKNPDWTVVKLDGSNKIIFNNNKNAGLILNENTVVEYARFVLGAVWAEDGNLRLIEAVDENTFTNEPTADELEEITRLVRPAIVNKTGDGFDLDVILLYGADIYQADVSVLSDGFLEIKDEELLAEDMPIRPILLE